MRLRTLSVLVALCTVLSTGNVFAHRSSEGEKFDATYNANGAVLKSASTTIYLGVRCDASSPTLGNGTWAWSNGGFEIALARKSLGFPRQEIAIDDQSKCQAGSSDNVGAATKTASRALSRDVHALCMEDQAESGHSKSVAKSLCQCVAAPLESGEQTVASDFTSMAGFYKKMQYVCAVEAGPEAFMEQFGN